MVVVYKEEGNDKVLHHHYEQLSKHSMHLGGYDEYLYTAEQAMIDQAVNYVNTYYPEVV